MSCKKGKFGLFFREILAFEIGEIGASVLMSESLLLQQAE